MTRKEILNVLRSQVNDMTALTGISPRFAFLGSNVAKKLVTRRELAKRTAAGEPILTLDDLWCFPSRYMPPDKIAFLHDFDDRYL